MTEPHTKTIASKLLEASKAVETVEKRGRNTQQNYDYVMAEDVFRAAQKAVQDQGLLLDFECMESYETPTTSKGGLHGLIVKAMCAVVVTDPDSGGALRRMAVGYGSDYPGDKAGAKAQTSARKYALIHLLGIPIGDEPEESRQTKDDTKIPEDIAGAIVAKVDDAEAISDATFRLAVGHVTKRDLGPMESPEDAVKALCTLTFDEAQQIDAWVNRKIKEAAETGD